MDIVKIMDLVIPRIIETILFNECRYAEIDLEEYGRGLKSNYSYFKLLITSLDAGFNEQNLHLMLEEILKFSVSNLKFLTFHFESNTKFEFSNGCLMTQEVTNPQEFGTSLSLEFSSFSELPHYLNSFMISKNYQNLGNFLLRMHSSFEDRSYLNIIASNIGEPDYISIITESIQQIVSQSTPLQKALSSL